MRQPDEFNIKQGSCQLFQAHLDATADQVVARDELAYSVTLDDRLPVYLHENVATMYALAVVSCPWVMYQVINFSQDNLLRHPRVGGRISEKIGKLAGRKG